MNQLINCLRVLGSPSRRAETSVKVTVISQNYPVFDQQVYRATIPEHYPVGSSVASLMANSPTDDKLIYAIIDGDRYGAFDVDFNIGRFYTTLSQVATFYFTGFYHLLLFFFLKKQQVTICVRFPIFSFYFGGGYCKM